MPDRIRTTHTGSLGAAADLRLNTPGDLHHVVQRARVEVGVIGEREPVPHVYPDDPLALLVDALRPGMHHLHVDIAS